ncbi:hypothetical protein DID74_01845 [Candidatus Marinamargulisbacteria bacterium SCGC AG-333-B06]|nr:hypothetical protein DID74_01845 [Candidatus Marinamargulisbacteria bacterium SCGC AG-333-B06]
MSDVEVKYFENEPESLNVILGFIFTAVFLLVVIIFSYFLFTAMLSQDKNEKRNSVKTPKLDVLNQEYEFQLDDLRWIDKSKGVVKVPVDVGMQYVIKRYN